MPSTIFMFSGQGSQYFQMGRALFEHDAVFRDQLRRLDTMASRLTGCSIVEAIYDPHRDKSESFDRTLLTHPAIFMVEYALAQTLMHAGVEPDATLGASLGTFAAAAISGVIDAEAALSWILEQASILEAHCEPGGMLAVLANPSLATDPFLAQRSDLAAVNFSSHFVLSAPQYELDPIEAWLRARDVTCQRLPVSFAYHSRWIEPARAQLQSRATSMRLRPARVPLICCERSGELRDLTDDHFWNVTRNCIRFLDTVATVERSGPHRYIDLGPAGTLTTFLKYALPKQSRSSAHTILSPYGGEVRNLARIVAGHRDMGQSEHNANAWRFS